MPNIEQKQAVIQGIQDKLDGASSVVLVDYRGLTVEEDTELRKQLREANVSYTVFKNTMVRFAVKGTEYEDLSDELKGPNALAISYEDATAGPRILKNMAKKADKLELKSGVVEGTVYDADGIAKIGSIAPKEELLSKLLGSLQAPMGSFARTMKALADKMEETGAAVAGDVEGQADSGDQADEASEEE